MSKLLGDLQKIAAKVKALPKPDVALIINPADQREVELHAKPFQYRGASIVGTHLNSFMGLRVFSHPHLTRGDVLTFKSLEQVFEAIEILNELQSQGRDWRFLFVKIAERYGKTSSSKSPGGVA